jgi:hypothetical protein
MIKRGVLFFVCFLFLINFISAQNYYVNTNVNIVDGGNFCSGKCTADDKIIVKAGERERLRFQNFHGNGRYIVITNENSPSNEPVRIVNRGGTGRALVNLIDSSWVDFRGDGDPDIKYGFDVFVDNPSSVSNLVTGGAWIYGKSEYVKFGYVKITFDGYSSPYGIGLNIQDAYLPQTPQWIYQDIEIHNNYIEGSKYSGMYIGCPPANCPDNTYPSNAGFSIHDNIIMNSGAYGLTYKRVVGPNNYIFNNKIINTGLNPTPANKGDSYKKGIGIKLIKWGIVVNVFDNYIENTPGPCVKVEGTDSQMVYNNTLVKCGTGNNAELGSAIFLSGSNHKVDDNIIIQPTRYGVYNDGTGKMYVNRNLIGDAGLGDMSGSNLVKGVGENVNVYHQDVADFNFVKWSDDGDYSNDVFVIGGYVPPSCSESCSNLGYSCGTQMVCGSFQNCGSCSGNDVCVNGNCQGVVLENSSNNLVNLNNLISHSNNFLTYNYPEKLWDNCFDAGNCSTISTSSNLIWMEFDLGDNYNLDQAKLFGDADGQWTSKNWTLKYKLNQGDSWQTVFLGKNAFINDWSVHQFSDVIARYVRVEIFGNGDSIQAREFRLSGNLDAGCIDCGEEWRLIYADSEEKETRGGWFAIYAFDGDHSTIWHTDYSTNEGNDNDPSYPHEIQIDLGSVRDIGGFSYLPRQDEDMFGTVKDYEFYVSNDVSNWGNPVNSGSFASDKTEKRVLFNSKSGRYIRFVGLSEINGYPWMTVAELGILEPRDAPVCLAISDIENVINLWKVGGESIEQVMRVVSSWKNCR